MRMYTASLDCLQGYYASDVYVMAEELPHAVFRAIEGIKEYIERIADETGYVAFIGPADEDDWNDRLSAFLDLARNELYEKLKPVPGGVVVSITV